MLTITPTFYFLFFLMIRRPPRSTLFPTRRSSDLSSRASEKPLHPPHQSFLSKRSSRQFWKTCSHADTRTHQHRRRDRSEEHTSELQSQSNLVCRLLLEKKKKKTKKKKNRNIL